MMSDSPRVPSSESRIFDSPAYQTRSVWVPEINELSSELVEPASPVPGSAGIPRSAVCTMVPDIPSTFAWDTSANSWAAVRVGRSAPRAAAVEIPRTAAVPPSRTATTANGASQRRAGTRESSFMAPVCRAGLSPA